MAPQTKGSFQEMNRVHLQRPRSGVVGLWLPRLENADSGTAGDGGQSTAHLLYVNCRLRLRNPLEVLLCASTEFQS